MFLTFSQIFSASKQIYHQIQQNPNSSKPKFSIPNKKKFIKLEINPKSENNKIRTTHATTTTTRKSEIKESKQIGDSVGRSRVWRMVRRFLGSRRSVANGFDDFWVRDLRNGFDSAISLSFCVCASESFLLSLSLSLWALLNERARSWVFWVRQSSWMWIDLTFTGAGVLVQSLFLVVSFSLLFSWGGSDLKWK